MSLPDIGNAEASGKTVLVRADLNVPMHNGRITDATRIIRFAPTVAALLQRGASVVVMSHLGRPGGVVNPTLSLVPVAKALGAELGREVRFAPDCVGAVAERVTRALPAGSVAVLENLRFHPGEEANDRSFALMLSVHADIYINDAPSCSKGAQASVSAIVPLMPAYAGPLLAAEAGTLDRNEALALPGIQALRSKHPILEDS